MTRERRRTHLLHKGRTACGLDLTETVRASAHAWHVTCGRCAHSIHMADNEAHAATKRRRKDRS